MSDAAVYTVPPIVNDPFGKCFVVPAMIACTRAKAAALVLMLVDVVLDMDVSLLCERRGGRRGEPPRSRSARVSQTRRLRGPHMDTPAAGADSAGAGEEIDVRGSILWAEGPTASSSRRSACPSRATTTGWVRSSPST